MAKLGSRAKIKVALSDGCGKAAVKLEERDRAKKRYTASAIRSTAQRAAAVIFICLSILIPPSCYV